MGYEIKLLIGRSSSREDEHKLGEPELDGDEIYRPYLKDDAGDYIKTGRETTYFAIYATIDLCKCGYESNIHNIDHVNKDESHFWHWYDGGSDVSKDCYGDEPKPIPISKVVDALKKDIQNDDYRRFKWALPLLEAMKDDPEGLSVLFYGH